MKEGIRKTLLFVWVLICVVGLIGCVDKELVFQDGQHVRSEEYGASFKTKYVESKNLDVHFASIIYDETTAMNVVDTVAADLELLKKQLKGISNKVNLYIVLRTEAEVPQTVGNNVYCTLNDIETNQYLECLTQAFLNTSEYWKTVGVYEKVFGENDEVDLESLKLFYQSEENFSVLSMFPVYFAKEFTDKETLKMSRMTARQNVEYMLDKLDAKKFLESDEVFKYEVEWITDLGVEIVESDIETRLKDIDLFATDKYPVTLRYSAWNFYLSKEDNFQDVKDYFEFFVGFLDQLDVTLSLWDEKDSVAANLIKEEMRKRIHFQFQTSDEVSYGNGDRRVASVGRLRDAVHEMFHVVIPTSNLTEKSWYYEGLTSYLTDKASYEHSAEVFMFYEVLTKGESYNAITTGDQKFFDVVADNYKIFAKFPTCIEEFDGFALSQAMAWTALKHPELAQETSMPGLKWNIDERYAGKDLDNIPKEGNRLCYYQSVAVIDYLAENYGLEKVVRVGLGQIDFEEAFGNFESIYEKVLQKMDAMNLE